jgi:cobalt-zinc-cadmium efflux system outer membrane protein
MPNEEDDDAMFMAGPSIEAELPIFDQNQAQIARAAYAYQQAARTVDALERAVAQEVRGAVDRTVTAWKLAELYRDGVVPLATSNMALAREAYQTGKVSWLSVLEAQRTLNTSRSRYVEAVRDAATSGARLEQAAGAPLARIAEGAKAPEQLPEAPEKPEGHRGP